MPSTAVERVSRTQSRGSVGVLAAALTFSVPEAVDSQDRPTKSSNISDSVLPQSECPCAVDYQSLSDNSNSVGSLDCTFPHGPNLDFVASRLAQICGVVAVYTSGYASETHVWIILDNWNEATLERVYQRQIELDKQFGDALASVDFHVMERSAADRYKAGWRRCQLTSI